MYRRYRRWGYESAALDLALSQVGGCPSHEALGREPQPMTFVVSLRLGEPASLEPLQQRLANYPSLRFKLDPTPTWTDEVVAGLVATGAVDSVDFKGHYEGAVVDVGADPDCTAGSSRRSRTPGSEDRGSRRRSTRSSSPTATRSPGTPRSTASPTSRRCRSRPGW